MNGAAAGFVHIRTKPQGVKGQQVTILQIQEYLHIRMLVFEILVKNNSVYLALEVEEELNPGS